MRSFSVAQNLDLEGYAGFLASAQNTMTFPFCDRETSSSLLWNFAVRRTRLCGPSPPPSLLKSFFFGSPIAYWFGAEKPASTDEQNHPNESFHKWPLSSVRP